MSFQVLFLINGLGMGNSTRCHAMIQYLAQSGVRVHVLTSGRGLEYFSDKPEIASLTSMESFHYESRSGRLSMLKTLLAFGKLYRIAMNKAAKLKELVQRIKPDLVVIDSEYVIWPLIPLKIPVIGINNSDVIVSEYLKLKKKPSSIKMQFWMIEFMDYLFHKVLCHWVISPAVHSGPSRSKKFRRVGLIVRRQIDEAACDPREKACVGSDHLKTVVIMLSGSVFRSTIDLAGYHLDWKIHVLGRGERQIEHRNNVICHGTLMDNVRILKSADILVVNGGFSAVSEALVLGKPTLVIPVPRHAEQYMNGHLVSSSGRGFVVTEETFLEKLKELHDSKDWGLDLNRVRVQGKGAKQASDMILSFLRELRSS